MTETSTMFSSTILTPKTSDVSIGLFQSFVDYLKSVCQPLLISLFESPIDIDELFNKQSSINAIKQFIDHGDCQTLYISRKKFNTKSSTVDLPDETLAFDFQPGSSGIFALLLWYVMAFTYNGKMKELHQPHGRDIELNVI